ncbi:recombinase RecT [Bacillus pumilus]|uniref:recombinase RecT n=1 Tax=Bacillus TaxID=1386 RepID=UPI0021C89191|nr:MULTISPECIES: RecT family recombinase [Bacillus]MCU0155732.1 recombinase RecT [Bacillus safensis]MCY7493215.1 recombinase RecT [Bacillus safensis]MDX5484886.1 recombinase RecT [Bacillus pumilus]MED4994145.1 recombinase RecT [Bacillus safensis]
MSNQNQLAHVQKDITDDVNNSLTRLQDDGLVLPSNYNASNALKSAFFKLQEVKDKEGRPALEICSRESIANSLLDMVVQGLSPAKTQCYFIVYGKQLQLNRSYFGTQAVLKRLTNVKDIWANVIFEGDVFDYEIDGGREKLIKHETKFENRDKPIIGAYAVVKTIDDIELLTIMTRKEIETSWSQAKTKAVQNKFPQEMAKRTVINRAAKNFINTSDDSDLLVQAINNSTENEYDNERVDVTPDEVKKEISENANSEIIDVGFNEPEEDSEQHQETPEIKQREEPEPQSSNGHDEKPSALNEEPPF